jgi:Na+/H+-translocating membrane pyrophosphatase
VLAVLVAYAVVSVIALVVRLATDRDLDPVAFAFNALMAASAGILGTVLAERHTAT